MSVHERRDQVGNCKVMHMRFVNGVLAAALVLGAVACADDPAQLFEVPGTGSLTGLVFLDADGDARFDPSAGDQALPGVRVRLQVRGTTEVISGAQAETNAAGRFTLASLPVGSHELAIDTVGMGAQGARFCQNPIPVNVFLREPQFQQVAARGGCLITIAEAEQQAPGSPATIRGVVISAPGQIIAGRMYLQDETGGIRLDNVQTGGATLAVGDEAEITGQLGTNEQELVLTGGVLGAHVPGATTPEPLLVTTRQIADAGPTAADPLQGTLVVVRKARVTVAWGNNTGSSRNAVIDDGSGPVTVRIDTGVLFTPNSADLGPALNALMGLDKCYDVIGIATSFRAGAQIFPRTTGDITEVPCN